MAKRHSIQKARGGKAYYEGGDSNVAKEAAEKNRGGAAVAQKMSGGACKPRLDKRARGGRTNATSSPFSSAHSSKFDA